MVTRTDWRARTQGDIAARVARLRRSGDLLGFRVEVLAAHLDFEHARPFLRAEVTAADWEADDPTDEGALREALADYVSFGWGKVIDHRSISAARTHEKVGEWLWLLGLDDLALRMAGEPWPQYGAPGLALVSRELGLPVPDSDGVRNMVAGEPCRPDCVDGCAR